MYYEIAFIAENALSRLETIEEFAQKIDDHFPNDVLTGFNIGLLSKTIRFWLVFEKFDQKYFSLFQQWIEKYQIQILKVMDLPHKKRDELFYEFILKADIKFIGGGMPIEIIFGIIKESFKNNAV